MSQPFYQVVVTRFADDPASDMLTTELLSLRVDALHEIAPKLAALYPPPIVKRSHRRKKEVKP